MPSSRLRYLNKAVSSQIYTKYNWQRVSDELGICTACVKGRRAGHIFFFGCTFDLVSGQRCICACAVAHFDLCEGRVEHDRAKRLPRRLHLEREQFLRWFLTTKTFKLELQCVPSELWTRLGSIGPLFNVCHFDHQFVVLVADEWTNLMHGHS